MPSSTMTNLQNVRVDGREGDVCTSGWGASTSTRGGVKRRRSGKRQNSGDSDDSGQLPALGEDPGGRSRRSREGGQARGPADSWKQDIPSTEEVLRARFYEDYRKVAEGYDKEFVKRYDEDLNTTLIFAGLFSAVTSAFIIEVNSQLQPDPNEETAALLRLLIYKVDNTTFGEGVPPVPQWPGPPRTIVQVQAILYASLATSLFSAFLAMLGKQWLNRYTSTGMRGAAIECGRDRQRKLNGIITWYFEYVMESLPLMLQAALLLLGCALCRYLWEINVTIASVVLCVTSFGVTFYSFIVAAGMASESCPYQTPGSRLLRSATLTVASAFADTVACSETVDVLRTMVARYWSLQPRSDAVCTLSGALCQLPVALIVDLFCLVQAVVQPLVAFARRVYTQLPGAPFAPGHGSDQQTTLLDLQCISWMLRTSLDKAVHLSALEALATMMPLADFDPTLVTDCFNVFIGCVKVENRTVVITQGLEQLATASAVCVLRTFSHLSVADPMAGVLGDVRQHYSSVFPSETHFRDFPFYHTLGVIHRLLNPGERHLRQAGIDWQDYKPSNHEHIVFAHALAKLAWSEYQRGELYKEKVPRWILRFALRALSLDPLPSTPIVVDCLSIIAVDLGCDISNTRTMSSDRSAHIDDISALISQKLETMIKVADPVLIYSKRKAITAFFPYAAWQEGSERREMLDMLLRAAVVSGKQGFMWQWVGQHVTALLDEENPVSPKRAVILASPHLAWWDFANNEHLIQLWAAATAVVPYTEDIGRCVVDTLLLVGSRDSLRPHLPAGMWSWLNKRPSLPPVCKGRSLGTERDSVRTIRGLGDIETLTSYLLLIWSEWDSILSGFEEMRTSIKEDFGGAMTGHHRKELLRRLGSVLGQLDGGLGYLRQHNPNLPGTHIWWARAQYKELRELLLEVDGKATEGLIHAPLRCAIPLPCP